MTGRKRTQKSINGGGIGVLVLGVALAVTGLVAVASFATKKNKAKKGGLKKPKSESQEELDHSGSKNKDETAQGPGSLLRNSPSLSSRSTASLSEPVLSSPKSSVVHQQQSPSHATSSTSRLPLPPSLAKSFVSSKSSEFSSKLPPSTTNQGSETPYKPSSTPTKLTSNSEKPPSLSTKSTASSSKLSPSQPRIVISVPNVNTSEATEKVVKTNHVRVENSPTNATTPYKPSSSSDNAPSLSSRSTASLSEPVLSSPKSPQNFHSVTNVPADKETNEEAKKIQVWVEKSPTDPKTHETSTQTAKSLLCPTAFNATSTGSKTNYLQLQESLIYAIPEEIKSLIKKNIVPEILKQPLSPLTYKDYFAALLYEEDFHLEKWIDFQLKNVIFELEEAEILKNWKGDDKIRKNWKGDYKTFAVFEIDSIPEWRPFLLSRDLVYARRLGSKAEPFQGIIHRVERSTRVLVEFGNDFHLSHRSTFRYDISFSFNRVCLKRAHQAVQAASNPLFHNFLFPDFVSRGSMLKPPTMLSVYHKNQMNTLSVIQRIVEIQRPPPYLVEGPLCVKIDKRSRPYAKELSSTGILVRDVICKIYQAPQACRILVCAPINMTCDMLTESLQYNIPDSDLFRANAAFRELDGVPMDILPSCILEGECFACPSWQELKEFRVILSTYISSFRLHNAGIGAGHFSHIFLLDALSATEPETLVVLTHFADDNTAVIVTGAPRNRPGWVRSDIARNHGLKESYFERLSDRKPYANLDPMFIAQLDDCEEQTSNSYHNLLSVS